MHPVVRKCFSGERLRLRDFVFMMRKDQVLAARVEIEALAQVLHAHGGALDVPAGTARGRSRCPSSVHRAWGPSTGRSRGLNSVLEHANIGKQRFLAAKDLLTKQPGVDAGKIAAIGYCFGGATVLNMARSGVDLAAVVSFHGNLVTKTPAEPGKVKAQILVLNGADDSFVTAESIANFEKEMQQAGVKYRFVNYPGAIHGFSNPDAYRLGKANHMSIAYNAEADKKSWAAMQELLQTVFKQ